MSGASVGAWLDQAARVLASAGFERPRAEARTLLAAALEVAPSRLFSHPEEAAPPVAIARADAFLKRRVAGEPQGRILGFREFWSLEFRLGPDVLEPRPDTETVVEAALVAAAGRDRLHILDMGVGSGCILLALLAELPGAWGVGVDMAAGAVRVARENAARLGVGDRAAFLCGDWASALADGRFDLVVANPPYIATAMGPAPDGATRRFDPSLALWGGPDGLDAYRAILPELPRVLAPGGGAFLEIGAGQARAARRLAQAAGLDTVGVHADLSGVERCLAFAVSETSTGAKE